MREKPEKGQVYRHFKGDTYKIITVARHSETGESMVVYTRDDIDDISYVRPLTMFMSEVDHVKYPYVKEQYRFTLVEPKEDAPAGESEIDPWLEKFLDAKDYEEKVGIFYDMHGKVSGRILWQIAMSLDLELSKEDEEDQYREILAYLRTMEKYECNRLRP